MKRIGMAAATLALATFAATAQANLLDDPSFSLATGGSATSNSAWVLTANAPDGSENAAQFQEAPWASNDAADPMIGVWLKAFEGNQADPPGSDPLAQAEISQTVGSGVAVLGSASVDLNESAPRDGAWNQYSLVAAAPAGTTGVRVYGRMVDGEDAQANPQSAFFDNFDLTEDGGTYTLLVDHRAETNYNSGATLLGMDFLGIPEPTSFALAAGGMFGLLGLRRKR